jgi:hypothetical protein
MFQTWEDKKRETFDRDGSALVLRVGMKTAVHIKNLSYECSSDPNHFNERMWSEGLTQILGYHLPRLQDGETYKMVIVDAH